jgi:hypothetical protein
MMLIYLDFVGRLLYMTIAPWTRITCGLMPAIVTIRSKKKLAFGNSTTNRCTAGPKSKQMNLDDSVFGLERYTLFTLDMAMALTSGDT